MIYHLSTVHIYLLSIYNLFIISLHHLPIYPFSFFNLFILHTLSFFFLFFLYGFCHQQSLSAFYLPCHSYNLHCVFYPVKWKHSSQGSWKKVFQIAETAGVEYYYIYLGYYLLPSLRMGGTYLLEVIVSFPLLLGTLWYSKMDVAQD